MRFDVAVFRKFAFALLTGLLFVGFAMPGASAQGAAVEGRQYSRIGPVPVETGKKIEVIEFFSYGCPHCAEIEPYLVDWLKAQPADVAFRRVPVMFQPRWVELAKVFYTLETMGEEAKLTPEVFSAIHSKGLALWEPAKFYDWAATKGLDRKKVEDTWNSFGVASRMSRAKSVAQAYNIQSVPTVIVDGKFITASDRVGGHALLPGAIDVLVAKARAERPKG